MADDLRIKCPTCENYPLQSTIEKYGTCGYCYRHGPDNQYKDDIEQLVFDLRTLHDQQISDLRAQVAGLERVMAIAHDGITTGFHGMSKENTIKLIQATLTEGE